MSLRAGKPRISKRRGGGGVAYVQIIAVEAIYFDIDNIVTVRFTFDRAFNIADFDSLAFELSPAILAFCDDDVSPAPWQLYYDQVDANSLDLNFSYAATTATGSFRTASNTDSLPFGSARLQADTTFYFGP